MNKLDIRICSCGRIHFVPQSEIDAALEADKNFVLICGGCGRVTAIGADIQQDWNEPDKTVYNMYAYPMGEHQGFTLTAEAFAEGGHRKAIHKVWYSPGEQVRMQTGYYAKYYRCGQFQDTWYPDFYQIQRSNITVPEIMEFIKKWEHDHVTVDMKSLLRVLSDEEAEALSHYHISGLNWKGTRWENEWNAR